MPIVFYDANSDEAEDLAEQLGVPYTLEKLRSNDFRLAVDKSGRFSDKFNIHVVWGIPELSTEYGEQLLFHRIITVEYL